MLRGSATKSWLRQVESSGGWPFSWFCSSFCFRSWPWGCPSQRDISWVAGAARRPAEVRIDAPGRLIMRLDLHFFRSPAGIALIVVTVVVLLSVLVVSLQPLPGRSIAIATGPAGSAYDLVAEQYRQILARDGVKLRLVPSEGAIDNVRLLRDRRSGVAVGFVQSGSVEPGATQDLESLGTIFYEPLWFFCRCSGALPLV